MGRFGQSSSNNNHKNHREQRVEGAKAFWVAGKVVLGLLVLSLAFLQSFLLFQSTTTTTLIGGEQNEGDIIMRLTQSFVNCTVVKRYTSTITAGSQSQKYPKPCALLFFGLAKQFRTVVLPSIRENILKINARCDIYLHNYNITTIATTNQRNGELGGERLYPEEVYDLTHNHVVWDTPEEFQSKRNMTYYLDPNRKPDKRLDWDRNSLKNMYKQWHSIERVWDLMEDNAQHRGIQYDRVGLFRTDVKYVTPIDILDGDAVIPDFGFLINDRIFYGTHENAHVWAKIRFPSVPCYKPRHESIRMHSEFFMNDLVLKNIPQVAKKDICFYRVRANGAVWDDDCTRKYNFPGHLTRLNLTYHI